MSRVAKVPVSIPLGVEVIINGQHISVKGHKGELTHVVHEAVVVRQSNDQLAVFPRNNAHHRSNNGWVLAGTTRALLNSMIIGITDGFFKKIQLIGVGYRAIVKGNALNLFLGFSHHVNYILPKNITAECLSQTEILIKGIDKQAVGQVAAELRSYRRPEPYKGKGIRYANEVIRTKEAKKK